MNKEEKRRMGELQIQWVFVVLGSLLAIFLGLVVNALYDILKDTFKPWGIVALFGLLSFLMIDTLNYFFDTPSEIRNPDESFRSFLWKYSKARVRKLLLWQK